MKLLNWVHETNAFIIEGDYDSEFRYHRKPIPALQGLWDADNVIYLSTTSRMGQQILQPFMINGHWESHIRKMRTIYSRKHAVLINTINQYLYKSVVIVGKDAGLAYPC